MTTRMPALCNSCLLHVAAQTCRAFPDAIPADIYLFGDDHREPVNGDQGLVWQFDPSKPEAYADWLLFNGGGTK